MPHQVFLIIAIMVAVAGFCVAVLYGEGVRRDYFAADCRATGAYPVLLYGGELICAELKAVRPPVR